MKNLKYLMLIGSFCGSMAYAVCPPGSTHGGCPIVEPVSPPCQQGEKLVCHNILGGPECSCKKIVSEMSLPRSFRCQGAASSIDGKIIGKDSYGRTQAAFKVTMLTANDDSEYYDRSGIVMEMSDGSLVYKDLMNEPPNDGVILDLQIIQNQEGNPGLFSVLKINDQEFDERCTFL